MPFPLDAFRGIFPAALTMFDRQNDVDEKTTAEHWDWLIEQGVDGLVIAGTSGEFIALEKEERIRLFRLAKDVVRGRVPVIYGSGHYSTKLTIQLCETAQDAGADGLIVILPYYQRPPKPAVMEHFRRIRRSIDVPVMLYNNPGNSACAQLTPQEIVELASEDVIHMVKSTVGSVEPIHDLRYLSANRVAIFYGSFLAAYEGVLAGADGWISGILNVVPRAAKAMYEACVIQNDAQAGFRIWREILPIIHLYTYQQVGPVSDLAIYRSMLKIWGRPGGYSRDPFFPLNGEQERALERLLEQSGWLAPEGPLHGRR